jgi:peptidyl-prolyl cis-trans isomerase C
MSPKRTHALIGSLCLTLSISPAGALEPDEALISRGGVTVTVDDFERLVDVRIPEDKQAAALARPGAVRELIAQLFIIRSLASDAKNSDDLDHASVKWRADVQRDRIRMEEFIKLRIAEAAAQSDWNALAREHYTAKPNDFTVPEQIRASHVLISLKDRGDEGAK